MNGIPWTEKDDAFLTGAYKRTPTYDIASRLGRTVKAVHQRADKLGINEKRDEAEIKRRKAQIRQLIKQGWSDSEVASKLNMARRSLTNMRSSMGVPANGRSQRYRQQVSKKTIEQCKNAGVKNLGEIRAKRLKAFSTSLGWPGLSVRAAQIAEALYRLGPMTRKQICQSIGMPWRGKKSLSSNRSPGGSYTAELQRAGIVVRLAKAITHKGKGNHEDLYMIGLEVEPCRKTQ